jgi:hypothetical protein
MEVGESMSARRMSQIVILAALCIALRLAFAPFPNVKPVTAFFLVSLLYLDFWDSFLIMMLTMLGSSLIFGFSLVVAWQILSFGILLWLWRFLVLPLTAKFSRQIWLQSLLAGLLTLSYGFWISIPIAFQFGLNLYLYWLNGLFFDLPHALSTVLFYPVIFLLLRRFYKDEKSSFRPD